jgi:hypothetical protein
MSYLSVKQSFEDSLNGQIEIHLVHNSEISSLVSKIENYRKSLFENDPEPDLTIPKLLSSLRFNFMMNPASLSPVGLGVSQRIDELVAMAQNIADAQEQTTLLEICELAREISRWESTENPLLQRAKSICGNIESVVLAVSRFRPALSELLGNDLETSNWKVHESGPVRDLRGLTQNLLIVGHPMFQESQEFRSASGSVPRVLRDPVATRTIVVMYGDQGEPHEIDGLINSSLPWARNLTIVRDDVPDYVIDPVELSEDDISHLLYRFSRNQRKLVSDNSRETVEENVEARMVLLSNGRFVMKSYSDWAHQYVVVLKGDKAFCRSVPISEVQTGSWIIERVTYAESDMIEAVANSRFGAAKFRKIQKEWKDEVNKAIRTFGLQRLKRMLAAEGLIVNPQSIQHWGKDPHSIGPDSFERVEAMCKIMELSNPDKLWAAMQFLRGAHVSAGHAVRDDLENLVNEEIESIKQNVMNAGMANVHLSGCGDLGVYLVEDVGAQAITVPLSGLNFVQQESDQGDD